MPAEPSADTRPHRGGARRGQRSYHRLTPHSVAKSVLPGRYPDGAGLCLHVGKTGGRSWVLRIQRAGKLMEFGLGPLHTVSLAQARHRAQALRLKILDDQNPLAEKLAKRAKRAVAVTFKEAVERYVENRREHWSNPRYAKQWPRSLELHAYPMLGRMTVAEIEAEHVASVLEALVAGDTPRTKLAIDLRSRIEAVLDFATTRKWRQGDNPARWKGHMEHLVAMKARKVVAHAALPYADLPVFMHRLGANDAQFSRALAFTILTVARTGMVQSATWAQIANDPTFGWIWTVPAANMKMRVEFRIPLSEATVHILRKVAIDQDLSLSTAGSGEHRDALIFPNRKGKALHFFGRVMDQLGYGQFTAHGFRSTYRTWAAETFKVRDYSHEIVEQVLAHKIRDAAEAAYARAEALVPRRKLMEEWAAACGVVPALSVVNG